MESSQIDLAEPANEKGSSEPPNAMPHLWLRAEQKKGEERCALTPTVAVELLQLGYEVTVESSPQRIFPDSLFESAGCEMALAGAWQRAPRDAWILGLKELDEDVFPLTHKHIHFCHVYKEQSGWEETLRRFKIGGGQLFDLEYLVEHDGKRVAAFGYWAGFAGAAVALLTWCGQQMGRDPVLSAISSWPDKTALTAHLVQLVEQASVAAGRAPSIHVIGALGRSGQGAVECARAAGALAVCWDLEETRTGGPFKEILNSDIFINCVLVTKKIPAFLTNSDLQERPRNLTVICDVSCDPDSEINPIPIYSECTSFADPARRLIESRDPDCAVLDLVAIDHLPSMLPLESSEDFVSQLAPYLKQLHRFSSQASRSPTNAELDGSACGLNKSNEAQVSESENSYSNVWRRSLSVFDEKCLQVGNL